MIATIFDAIVKSDRKGRGAAGETFAQDLFKQAGYGVRRNRLKSQCGDLKVYNKSTGEYWNIEVKTAARRPDGKYCFQLVCETTARTDYRHSDYVLLLAVMPGGKVAIFLIPASKIEAKNVKSITISNVNSGRWSHYRVKRNIRLEGQS